jgi:hypothetical protein
MQRFWPQTRLSKDRWNFGIIWYGNNLVCNTESIGWQCCPPGMSWKLCGILVHVCFTRLGCDIRVIRMCFCLVLVGRSVVGSMMFRAFSQIPRGKCKVNGKEWILGVAAFCWECDCLCSLGDDHLEMLGQCWLPETSWAVGRWKWRDGN